MKDLDPAALESLIDFAYTSKVKITIHNVQPLLIASEFLQLTQVRDSCCDFLSKRLDSSCVMNVRALGDKLNCLSVVKNADSYIRKNIEAFCQTKEFLGLSFSFLNELIRRDGVLVASEEKVFDAVMSWVKTNSERHKSLPDLLTGVRMTYLTPQFLIKKASKEKLIMDSMVCRNLLDEAKHYHLLPEEGAASCSFTVSERCCGADEARGIYLFCCNKTSGLTIFRYIFATGKWRIVVNDKARSDLKHVLALGDKIYVFRPNNFEMFNPRTHEWIPRAMFPSSHDNFNHIVASKNMIYWLGNSQNSSEGICFNNELNQWNLYWHLNLNLNSDEDVLVCGDSIYVFWASNAAVQRDIKYDFQRPNISYLTLERETRSDFGSADLGDSIYLCGGTRKSSASGPWGNHCRNSGSLTRTEIYRPSQGLQTASPMNIPRRNFSLLTYEKKLYAIGGTTDPNYVEVYDPPANKWTVIGGRIEGQYHYINDFVKAVAIGDKKN